MKSQYCFLLEASGSLTAAYLIENVKRTKAKVIVSDVVNCYGNYLADGFLSFPRSNDPTLWKTIESDIKKNQINVILPSLDETLYQWSAKKEYFFKQGVHVILSDSETIEVCQDKWKTFEFFSNHNIPTPATSLNFEFPLVKPRLGRGGKGILINPEEGSFSMDGMISQQLLQGKEYTIDVFCDRYGDPVYIIPRLRLHVKEGKSLNGITVENNAIIQQVKKICGHLKFFGPVNFQCFEDDNGVLKFTEINPRIGGGMALGFAASENWISLIISNLIEGKPVHAKPVKFGMQMFRYYAEVFVSGN